jgi:coproporphyrinogen III oxidase
MRYKMEAYVTNLQGKVIKELQKHEPEVQFKVDKWARKEGGGGITCIAQDGQTFERAAVNVSVVKGVLPAEAVKAMRSRGKKSIPEGRELPFFACGISSVIHPRNPNVPTIHFNYRFFEIEVGENKYESWFGGGTDLTPYYLNEEDARHFHATLKQACDKHDKSYYGRFKKWCDDYFLIPHRGERRGIGGIFFDDLDFTGGSDEFDFVRSCGDAVLPSYLPMLVKNKDQGYGLKEREWQLLRRGR